MVLMVAVETDGRRQGQTTWLSPGRSNPQVLRVSTGPDGAEVLRLARASGPAEPPRWLVLGARSISTGPVPPELSSRDPGQ